VTDILLPRAPALEPDENAHGGRDDAELTMRSILAACDGSRERVPEPRGHRRSPEGSSHGLTSERR